MHLLQNLSPSEVSSLCLLIAIVALFLAIILTIIHYMTRVLAGFALGLAAGAQGYWPMIEAWARDVLIPVVIGLGSLLVWAAMQLWERFAESGLGGLR
jgi:zinc transporter ZupT